MALFERTDEVVRVSVVLATAKPSSDPFPSGSATGVGPSPATPWGETHSVTLRRQMLPVEELMENTQLDHSAL